MHRADRTASGARNRSELLVEFVGVPGVGKSTIARLLARRFDSLAYELTGYTDLDGSRMGAARRWADRGVSLLRQPALSVEVFSALAQESDPLARSFLANLVRRNRAMLRVRHSDSLAILEEASIHALVLALCARNGRWEWRDVAARLEFPDMLVWVDSPAAVAHGRLVARAGVLASASLSDAALLRRRYLRNCAEVLDDLGVPVIQVDSSLNSAEECSGSIAAAVGKEWPGA